MGDYFGTFGKTRAEALEKLLPVVEALLGAHEAGNYKEFCTYMNEIETPEQIFLKGSEELKSTFGCLVSKKFLGALKRKENPMLLFSAKYTATGDDVLITVLFNNGTQPPKGESIWIS